MTTRTKNFRAKFALGAALASIAFAGTVPVALAAENAAESYIEQVSFADLDLRQARDQQTLKSRVRAAVREVCSRTGETPKLGLSMESTCVGETMRQTKPQLIAAIDDAHSGRQMASSVVINRTASLR